MFHFMNKPRAFLRTGVIALAMSTAMIGGVLEANAQSRDKTLVVITEEGPATLDIHGATANAAMPMTTPPLSPNWPKDGKSRMTIRA